jgi:hypothetical protein
VPEDTLVIPVDHGFVQVCDTEPEAFHQLVRQILFFAPQDNMRRDNASFSREILIQGRAKKWHQVLV